MAQKVTIIYQIILKSFKALLCFQSFDESVMKCDFFNGTSLTTTFSPKYTHRHGGLAFYQDQPTTVGGGLEEEYNYHDKVETLTSEGWVELSNHPE